MQGLANVGTNALDVVRMFIDRGDPWVGHNIPGRPALDVIAAVGFWVGLVIAVLHWRRSVHALLLAWLVIMLVPTVLTEPSANFVRAIGALPPIFLLVADGWMRLWDRFAPRVGRAALLAVVIGLGGLITARDYMSVWAPSAETFQDFDAGIVTLARQARVLSTVQPVVMPLRLYGQPAPQFLLASEFLLTTLMTTPFESQLMFFLTPDPDNLDSAVVILRRSADGQAEALIPQFLKKDSLDRMRLRMETTDIFRLLNRGKSIVGTGIIVNSSDLGLAPSAPEQALSVAFANRIRLVGYDIDPKVIAPNQKITSTLLAIFGRT